MLDLKGVSWPTKSRQCGGWKVKVREKTLWSNLTSTNRAVGHLFYGGLVLGILPKIPLIQVDRCSLSGRAGRVPERLKMCAP